MIDAISQAVAQTPGCVLLDVDAGPSTNRTVYTFVGSPEDVVEGAFNAARAAFQLIDMSKHKGEGLSCPQGTAWGLGACPGRTPTAPEGSQMQPMEPAGPGGGAWCLRAVRLRHSEQLLRPGVGGKVKPALLETNLSTACKAKHIGAASRVQGL